MSPFDTDNLLATALSAVTKSPVVSYNQFQNGVVGSTVAGYSSLAPTLHISSTNSSPPLGLAGSAISAAFPTLSSGTFTAGAAPSIGGGLIGGGLYLSHNFRAPKFDHDFSKVSDSGVNYERGGLKYKRPCGWNRFALNVLDQYEEDDKNAWLGAGMTRKRDTDSVPNEWPVSYHGTGRHNAKSIAEAGFDLSKGTRFLYGRGIYSTPDIRVAEQYAVKFTFEGKRYKVVLQTRANRATTNVIPASETGVGEYWVTTVDKDIRPYGLCIKELEDGCNIF